MAGPSELPPLAALAAGVKFSSFILQSFGIPVAPPSSTSGSFALLVAFGRCRSRLDDLFVAEVLSAILGGPADSFQVSLVEDRIFLFLVSSKAVGFEVYKLKKFACSEFELFFQLFNDSGLSFARSHICSKPVFPWVEVKKKFSFADKARLPAKVLTGANSIPLGSSVGSPRMVVPRHQRASVFDRIIFPKVSVFDRLSWTSTCSD